MLYSILLKNWKALAGILAVVVLITTTYSYVYNKGYNARSEEVAADLARHAAAAEAQAIKLEQLSKKLSDVSESITAQNSQNLATILLSVKNKPLYVITPEGKCMPSKEFETAYTKLLK